MSLCLYILNSAGVPVPCHHQAVWSDFMQNGDRIADQTTIEEIKISTAFVGVTAYLGANGVPLLWETMVTWANGKTETWRHGGNKEQAEAYHWQLVENVRKRRQRP